MAIKYDKPRKSAARLVAESTPALAEAFRLPSLSQPAKRRGRPPSGKVRVHIMLNPATIEAFKAGGPGWQARMSDAIDQAAPK